jgi:NADH dehydrogenase FAD-containing subunit
MGTQTNYSPTFPMFPGGAETFTNSDTRNLPTPSVIYVGGLGNVKVTTAQGDEVTFTNVQAGNVLPVQVIRVWATGTTASSLLRIY